MHAIHIPYFQEDKPHRHKAPNPYRKSAPQQQISLSLSGGVIRFKMVIVDIAHVLLHTLGTRMCCPQAWSTMYKLHPAYKLQLDWWQPPNAYLLENVVISCDIQGFPKVFKMQVWLLHERIPAICSVIERRYQDSFGSMSLEFVEGVAGESNFRSTSIRFAWNR